jgi:hypothetical protein
MKRKQTVYYVLANIDAREKAIKMYDALTDSKRILKEEVPIWNKHLYIKDNNRAFLDQLLEINDIQDVKRYLFLQMALYTKNFLEKYTYDNIINWLEQTEFLCTNEFNQTNKQIYNVAIEWCKNFKENDLEELNLESSTPDSLKNTSLKKPTHSVVALFCNLISYSGVKPKGEQNVASFCESVCISYNLEYKDNVRQYYNDNFTKRNFKKIESLIFPYISSEVKEKIYKYTYSKKLV